MRLRKRIVSLLNRGIEKHDTRAKGLDKSSQAASDAARTHGSMGRSTSMRVMNEKAGFLKSEAKRYRKKIKRREWLKGKIEK